ncbi:MAG: hypothetical protein [Caudoviricetes sp.]|nr:MAG: hypothetical protein [Caudoviricetes sp.]
MMQSFFVFALTDMLSPPSRSWMNHVPLFNFRGFGTFIRFHLPFDRKCFIIVVASEYDPREKRAPFFHGCICNHDRLSLQFI